MTRRELRKLREAQEAERGQGPAPGEDPAPDEDPAPEGDPAPGEDAAQDGDGKDSVPESLPPELVPAMPERAPEVPEPRAEPSEEPDAERRDPDWPDPAWRDPAWRDRDGHDPEATEPGEYEPDVVRPEPARIGARESLEGAESLESLEPGPLPRPEPLPALVPGEQPAGFVKPVEEVTGLRGFRGWLHRISGGAIFGQSAEERAEAELDRRIRRGIGSSQNTAFLSLKGGVGKTSTTVGVGLTLAGIRAGSVCAIDANPDAGDLIERALGEGAYESERELTITRLLQDIGDDESRDALDSYLHESASLRLLAGEQDPELSDSLTAEDYRRVYNLVSRHYGVTLTDCGTGVSRPAMRGILENADNVVVAAGFAVSGAKRARDTLAWLASHGFAELARNAIVVVTDKDGVSARVDKAAIEATLGGMCRVLISVPHDNAIADGDLISLSALRPETRRSYREIAAAIVDGYR
ncbi:MinD/ParA family protein [Sinomonas sp. G460-2]|uniref:nucleotide-binding protein n=1 Tax=Sinomonas sp. G460-2 TaxID=3393464 RepID=UPI0039F11074